MPLAFRADLALPVQVGLTGGQLHRDALGDCFSPWPVFFNCRPELALVTLMTMVEPSLTTSVSIRGPKLRDHRKHPRPIVFGEGPGHLDAVCDESSEQVGGLP